MVQADSSTDFKLVRKAIYSLNAAGWSKINFITTIEAGAKKKAAAAALEAE